MLTIFAALQDEIKLIKSEMEVDSAIHIKPFSIYRGSLFDKKITLVRTGLGEERAKNAVDYFLKNLKTSAFLNVGYAGGLDPRLQAGDLVIVTKVIDSETEEVFNLDENLIKHAEEVCTTNGFRYHKGPLLRVEKSIDTPHEKAFAGTKFEAIACDMESSAISRALKTSSKPFSIVKSIFDTMDTAFPGILEKAVEDGEIRVGPILEYMVSHPKDILKLPKMSYLSNQARIAVTKFVEAYIKDEKQY